MTRQIERQQAREHTKMVEATIKAKARTVARRALLERQSARENSGAYIGRSVAAAISPSRSRITKRKVQKDRAGGRIIRTIIRGSREYQLHATRGWRSYVA